MKITFIGGGNMAAALIGGLLGRGHQPGDIAAVEIAAEARAQLAGRFGVRCAADPAEILPGSDAVVLAVKPQHLREALTAASPYCGDAVVLSIAAGIRLRDIARWLGRPAALVRAMPNTPALIGLGISGAYAAPQTSATQRRIAGDILAAAGKVVWVDTEALLDPVTAVSGSGPAYVFFFIESLTEAGIALGLSAEAAGQLALETFRGAAELAARSEETPARLRARVTSRGGTTERAIATLEAEHVRAAVARAVAAANRRAGELADEFGRQD